MGELLRLLMAMLGKVHINPTTEDAVILPLHFGVADEKEFGRRHARSVGPEGLGKRVPDLRWGQGRLLCDKQFADAGLAEGEQFGELTFGERGFLAGALHFDELAGGVHN